MQITKETNYQIAVDEDGNYYRLTKTGIYKRFVVKPDAHGYIRVGVRIEGKVTNFAIHRLVAQTYLPNPNNLPIVNHKDADKTNNKVSNLEWVSEAGNLQHASKSGLLNVKEKANISVVDILLIVINYVIFKHSKRYIASYYDTSATNIRYILTGRRRRNETLKVIEGLSVLVGELEKERLDVKEIFKTFDYKHTN